jgi:hypothetical protein
MEVKSPAMKVIEKADNQQAIMKTVNKKYVKSQPKVKKHQSVGVPFIDASSNAIEDFFVGIGRLILAAWSVIFFIPVIIMGVLEGISQGLLKGLQKATTAYEKHLNVKSGK